MKALLGVFVVAISGLCAWLFWGPVLGFFLSLIPVSEFAWVGKLLCVVLVAWLGGIGLPIFILFGGLACVLAID